MAYDQYGVWTDDNQQGPGQFDPYPPAPAQPPAVDPDYNGGVAPPPPAPRYDYNAGSPPDQALPSTGHGWVWSGPTEQSWNAELGQWDRGVWETRLGQGLGYNAPAPSGGGGGQPSGGGGPGAVPPMGGGMNIPGSQLPGDITALFNKVPQKSPIQQAYQDALLQYMGRAQQTPSLDDPILGPQTEVYRVQQQRNQERNRKVNAERAAATGQSQSGYLDNQINKGLQEQNFNTASYNANLLGGEMTKRRDELLNALSLARASGDAESERELRARLAQVSAMMQQQGLNLQGQLGMGDLALRLMQTQMGNDQFYDQLGINTNLSMEDLNQRALRLGLGG